MCRRLSTARAEEARLLAHAPLLPRHPLQQQQPQPGRHTLAALDTISPLSSLHFRTSRFSLSGCGVGWGGGVGRAGTYIKRHLGEEKADEGSLPGKASAAAAAACVQAEPSPSRTVGLLQRTVELVVLDAEPLEALVARELVQNLRGTQRKYLRASAGRATLNHARPPPPHARRRTRRTLSGRRACAETAARAATQRP
jgi:hypothetical protein